MQASSKVSLKRKSETQGKSTSDKKAKKEKKEKKGYARADSLAMYKEKTLADPTRLDVLRNLADGTIGCCFCVSNQSCHIDIIDELYRRVKKEAGEEVKQGIIRQCIKVDVLRKQRGIQNADEFFRQYPNAVYMGRRGRVWIFKEDASGKKIKQKILPLKQHPLCNEFPVTKGQ
jgi:hypothetical protein